VVAATIIACNGSELEQHRAFYFHSNEDANSIVDGFTIIKGYASNGGAINCVGSDPTIMNCIIIGNSVEGTGFLVDGSGGGVCCLESNPAIINCTIIGNQASHHGGGICSWASSPTIINCILWDNTPEQIYFFDGTPVVSYSDVEGGFSGTGNIDLDPCFVDPGFWHPNDTPNDANDDFWVNGDYHLKSEAGRWDPNEKCWIEDADTSPAVDAGDPGSDWTAELWPHGKCINMGAYGGTPQASMSLSPSGNIADLNNDNFADWQDLKLFAHKWLHEEVLLSEDLDRNAMVNFGDFAIFAENWLWEQ